MGASALFIDSTTGTIRVEVTTEDGDVLPGVVLVLSSPNLSHDQTSVSDANGVAQFTNLVPAIYELEGTMEGMKTQRVPNISVGPGVRVPVKITMEPEEKGSVLGH